MTSQSQILHTTTNNVWNGETSTDVDKWEIVDKERITKEDMDRAKGLVDILEYCKHHKRIL